ncbi:Protein N-acetyltransferase, RimJ/RimL family [Fervidobacterium changbaicum]|uniref:GNAT family N-acetyltransferase n=2 Tax=Fervidobacterium TaxID=2422 RepID=A0AAI8CMF6_FERIS|nr:MULTISPECIES: GNAT family protein [Fervidobacterium]AMW33175.1 GNAT family N-acetyltransferase [Fervidobacterium islandicum]QAV33236.1 N-acetyltransferase [Fervidobacterium changbaicum]SDH76050.1 Protein N-acetyltransferase, RimJ/RimL family [Fervidobacterium changbaicum]
MRMEGKLATLRPMEVSDAQKFVQLINDEKTKEYLSLVFPMNQFLEEEWIKKNAISHNQANFSIEAGDNLIGSAGLMGIDWVARSAEYGIAIFDPNYWNKGIGTEVTQMMLRYAFEYLNLNRVWLRVFENNQRAIRVYEKCGFIQEGRMRQARYLKGQYFDVIIMSILADEYWRIKSDYQL